MVVAMIMGVGVYKLKVRLGLATMVALLAFFGLILLGVEYPVLTHEWLASPDAREQLAEARTTPVISEGEELFPAPYGALAAENYLRSQGWEAEAASIAEASKTARRTWILTLLGYGFFASILRSGCFFNREITSTVTSSMPPSTDGTWFMYCRRDGRS
jgi:carbon starvation protein